MNWSFYLKMFSPTIVAVALSVMAAGNLEFVVFLAIMGIQVLFLAYYGLKALIRTASS